jgi:hypothetical protein
MTISTYFTNENTSINHDKPLDSAADVQTKPNLSATYALVMVQHMFRIWDVHGCSR